MMKPRVILGAVFVLLGLGLAGVNFFSTHIDYGTFADARKTLRITQVRGTWIRDKGIARGDSATSIFFMYDDASDTVEVVLTREVPVQFESVSSIVVQGKYEHGRFYATEVLTKCPSKYVHSSE